MFSSSIKVISTAVVVAVTTIILSLAINATSSSPSTDHDEGEALRSTGWWNSSSPHCDWAGVSCNDNGSVTGIIIFNTDQDLGELTKLNFSSFPNLLLLSLYNCGLNGSIPHHIGTLSHLTSLILGFNNLTGQLPLSLSYLTQLELFSLYSNRLHGSIPPQIGKMKNLITLDLGHNHFTGFIPSLLGQLTKLEFLYLNCNRIKGSIPFEIGQLENADTIFLNNNNLTGVIPSSLGNLTNLIYLTLRGNQISGYIPPEIGNLRKLSHLDISDNLISENIPSQLGNLKKIDYLNLSHNNLSGPIPHSLSNYTSTKIDLSHDHLEGHIPFQLLSRAPLEAFAHNKALCGEIKGLPHCKNRYHQIILVIVVSLFATAVILGLLFCVLRIRKNQYLETTKVKNGDLFSIWDYDGVIAYRDIIQATEDFDIKYCIGTGGYGSVYRAQLPSGNVVALKKLHGWESEDPTYLKSFENEVQILSTIQHRNIVKLHGFCLHNKCMFLVYKYMERGSLYCILRDEVEAVELDWITRVNVVKGIANALSYMHHDWDFPIIHRDISSNNILLDSNFEAFVSDFGTARLLDPDSSNQTLLVGTYGYIAPGNLTRL